MEHKDNLLSVLSTLFRWKKQIFYVCLITGIGAVAISLFMDNWYESSTIFYAASPDQALPKPVGVEDTDRKYYGEPEDVDRILSICESGAVANFLIDKYNLYEHYDIDTTSKLAKFNIMKAFRSHYDVRKTEYGAIELAMEDKEPVMAANMVNDARNRVVEISQNIIKGNQSLEMKTFENTINEKNKYLVELGDSIQKVRVKFGVYNTITQSEGLSQQISSAEGLLARERARRGILAKKSFGGLRDTLAMIDAVIEGTTKQIEKLNSILDQFNKGVAKVELLDDLHSEASEQLSLDQERLKQLQSINNSYINTIFLVEAGEVPVRKSRPKRSLICLAAVFIAFILSVAAVLLMDTYKDVNWREIYNGR